MPGRPKSLLRRWGVLGYTALFFALGGLVPAANGQPTPDPAPGTTARPTAGTTAGPTPDPAPLGRPRVVTQSSPVVVHAAPAVRTLHSLGGSANCGESCASRAGGTARDARSRSGEAEGRRALGAARRAGRAAKRGRSRPRRARTRHDDVRGARAVRGDPRQRLVPRSARRGAEEPAVKRVLIYVAFVSLTLVPMANAAFPSISVSMPSTPEQRMVHVLDHRDVHGARRSDAGRELFPGRRELVSRVAAGD